MNDLLSLIASFATAVGVTLAAWQLWLGQRQSTTAFEDTFAKEYRELAKDIPTEAFLGDSLSDADITRNLNDFYHYFDLCNQQIFLNDIGRISRATWTFWRDGIVSNLDRPAFSRAWSEIASRAGSDFTELRSLCPPKLFLPRYENQPYTQVVRAP